MAIEFDPSLDLAAVADGLQAVTLVRPGNSAATVVAHALCRTIRTREAQASEGQHTKSDVVWHLPASELPETPRLGDVIVDAQGRRWTVLQVRAATLGSRWRCVARDLAIVHRLDETIRIEKAVYAKGPSGAEEATWHLWRAGLRARIQPAAQEVGDQHERTVTPSAFKIFVAQDVDVDHTCRIRGPDGKIYRIVGCRKAERIDALVEIDVVLAGA